MIEIVELSRQDGPAVVEVLANAFERDAGFAAITRASGERQRDCIRAIYGLVFAALDAARLGARVDGKLAGVLLYERPGAGTHVLAALVAFVRALFAIGPAATWRMVRLGLGSQRMRPREPHVYLAIVGVDPSMQGRGVGKRLIEEVHRRAAALGLPVALDTDEPRNVSYYRQLGYQERARLSRYGVEVVAMARRG